MTLNTVFIHKGGRLGVRHSYHMGVSKNSGTPKSSILIGFSIINHPFWGPYFWKHPYIYVCMIYHIWPLNFNIAPEKNNIPNGKYTFKHHSSAILIFRLHFFFRCFVASHNCYRVDWGCFWCFASRGCFASSLSFLGGWFSPVARGDKTLVGIGGKNGANPVI